jgi:hypothetical protein
MANPEIALGSTASVAPANALRTGDLHRLVDSAYRIALLAGSIVAFAALALVAWEVRHGGLYKSANGFGYALGVVGGLMMLGLLLYPMRKRVRFMYEWGPLKYWFWFHMAGGILGPILILYHSTFHVRSVNAAVALVCMVLVVASGLVGRFIYRKIHHGLYGSHATLKDLEQLMARELEALEPVLQKMPLVKQEVERFVTLVSYCPEGTGRRALHFLSLGAKRIRAQWSVRFALRVYAASNVDRSKATDRRAANSGGRRSEARGDRRVHDLLRTISSTLQAAQRRAQFSTYEWLFSLWHVIHIPFLCMLVITALVHVLAVHIY